MSLLSNLTQVVQDDVQALKTLHYEPHLVGGVLRVAALGGTTHDVDIALIVGSRDMAIRVVIERMGYDLQHTQDSKYADETNGFLADYRKEDVNIILYSAAVYEGVADLVASFDLGINKYYLKEGVMCNDHFNGKDVIYTENSNHKRHLERIQRFATEYPDLNWEQPRAEQARLITQGSHFE